MRSLILLAAASLAVSGCTQTVVPGGVVLPTDVASPAPLQRTVIDDRAIRYAFLSFDTILTLVDSAIAAKLIVPRSQKALTIAGYLQQAKNALNAASAAQRAGSAASYNAAFAEATRAIALAKQAIQAR